MNITPKQLTLVDIKDAYFSGFMLIGDNPRLFFVSTLLMLVLSIAIHYIELFQALSAVLIPSAIVYHFLLAMNLDSPKPYSPGDLVKIGLVNNKLLILLCIMLSIVMLILNANPHALHDMVRTIISENIYHYLVGENPKVVSRPVMFILFGATIFLAMFGLLEKMYLYIKFGFSKDQVQHLSNQAFMRNPFILNITIVMPICILTGAVYYLPLLLPLWLMLSFNILFFGIKAIYEGSGKTSKAKVSLSSQVAPQS